MLEWLKTILGAAYTPEIDTAVSQEIGKGFVSRADFDAKAAKAAELEAQVGQLQDSAKTDKAKYEKELAQVQLMAAVDLELAALGSKNNIAVKAVLADFLKDAKMEGGKVVSKDSTGAVTLAAKVEALKKDSTTDFLFGELSKQRQGWKPGENGEGGKPGAVKKPSEMTYSELTEYLANHPEAQLN